MTFANAQTNGQANIVQHCAAESQARVDGAIHEAQQEIGNIKQQAQQFVGEKIGEVKVQAEQYVQGVQSQADVAVNQFKSHTHKRRQPMQFKKESSKRKNKQKWYLRPGWERNRRSN